MQIEEKLGGESIQSILKDPKKYRKMMLIMEQTLYDLGYHESAKMLQNQSGINFYSQQLLQIKQLLERDDFEGAIRVVDKMRITEDNILDNGKIDQEKVFNEQKNGFSDAKKRVQEQQMASTFEKHSNRLDDNNNYQDSRKDRIRISQSTLIQARMMIYETYCMHKIMSGQYEEAMEIISHKIQNQTKKQFLCEALVLGNHHLSKAQLQKKKEEIFKYCLSSWQEIGQKEIQRVIQSYRMHEGDINKEIKSLLSEQKLYPPMQIVSIEYQKEIKHTITHMRLENGKVYLVEENKDTQLLHVLGINYKNLEYQAKCIESGYSDRGKYGVLQPSMIKIIQMKYKGKRQSIESMAVNKNIQNPLIGLCSFNTISIYSAKLDQICHIQSNNKIEKFLYIDFHPLTQLLFTCGYFQTINAIDSRGQVVMSVYPFPKMRKFLFQENNVIGISLVTNKVYKHSLDQQILLNETQLDDSVLPMDISISDKNSTIKLNANNKQSFYKKQLIAISSLQYIYILDSESLNILGKTISPSNPNKVIIQVKFYHHFIITLAKNFTAYQILPDQIQGSDKPNENKMRQENEQIKGENGMKKNKDYELLILNKFKQWSGEGTFQIRNEIMISGMREVTIWQSGEVQCQMEEQSMEEQGVNENLIYEMEEISQNLSLDSDSSLNSDQIEQEEESFNQEEQQEEEDLQII